MAEARRQELQIRRDIAAALGRSAVKAAQEGFYLTKAGQAVVWRDAVEAACAAKQSISPRIVLPSNRQAPFAETRVQVTNETTLGASLRLVERGLRQIALNFANGFQPGGGFLLGATAQEEVLCRSSALYQALLGDPVSTNIDVGNCPIRLIRQSTHRTFQCSAWMMARNLNILGCSVSLRVPRLTHQPLDSHKPVIS
jgi:Uncharacterized protein conserved in bacteria (DUF2263)